MGSERAARLPAGATPPAMAPRDGVGPSCIGLPAGPWATLLDFLCERFPAVPRAEWRRRLAEGEVVDEWGETATPERPYRAHQRLYYYRRVPAETPIPFEARVLHRDEHLLVVDKPHFLPVVPSGPYLQHTLLVRLRRTLGLPQLTPLHRLDRDTAGVMLLSVQAASRGPYHALLREHRLHKVYHAVAPWRADLAWPLERHSRIERDTRFFRSREVPGEANALTRLAVLRVDGARALYQLQPVTGRMHQLRVHLAALGLPIENDPLYPQVREVAPGDFSRPLQLLAQSLRFTDPLSGRERGFESGQSLSLRP